MPKQTKDRKLKAERTAPYRKTSSTRRHFFFEEEHLLEGEDAIENLYRDARKTCTGVMEPRENWALYGDQYKLENLYFINQQFGKSTGFDKRLVLKERLANGEIRIASDITDVAVEVKLFKKEHTLYPVPPTISRAKRELPSVKIMRGKNEQQSLVVNGRVKLRLRINAVSSQFGNRPFVIRLQPKGGNPDDMVFKPFHFQPIFVRSKYPRFARAKKSKPTPTSASAVVKKNPFGTKNKSSKTPILCLPSAIKKEPFWNFNPAIKKALGTISKVKINVGRPAANASAAAPPVASLTESKELGSSIPLERMCSISSIKSVGSTDFDFDCCDLLSPLAFDPLAEVKVDIEFSGEDSLSSALTDEDEDDLFAANDDWIQDTPTCSAIDFDLGFDFSSLDGIKFFE